MLQFSDLNDIEPLTRSHSRASFSCGVGKLDNYIKHQSIRNAESNFSRVFVLTLRKSPDIIVGYYSLSALQISMEKLAEHIRKELPKYPVVGTTLLGRLAVDEKWQRDKCNLKLGEHLLVDAMVKAWHANQLVASYAMIVDVLIGEKGDPTPFYTKSGFQSFSETNALHRLYLPMTTIEQVLQKIGIIF